MMASRVGSEVVVVGGGIAGVTAAYLLARAGVDVHLIEKSTVGASQSGRNWGFIRRQACDPAEVHLVQSAAECWNLMVEEIGEDLTVQRQGLINLAASTERLEAYRAWLEETNATSLFGTVLVDPDDIKEIAPFAHGDWLGGLYTPTDGHADPLLATRKIAEAAKQRGATVSEGVTAFSLSRAAGESVAGVVTSNGHFPADKVIVAAGAWSRRLLGSVGLQLPVRLIRATAGRTNPVGSITPLAVAAPDVGFSQAPDGSLIFGTAAWSDYDISLETLRNLRMFFPNFVRNRKMIRLHLNSLFWEDIGRRVKPPENEYDWKRLDDPPPNHKKINHAFESLVRVLPGVKALRMASSWAGTVDVTPDALPVVGEVDAVPNLLLASGLSSHGFGVGPGVAKAATDLALGHQPEVDISEFSLGRFRSGARIKRHEHL